MADKINPVDHRILKLLSKNARLTYKELAELLGTTRQRISRRMNRLEQSGVILKYTVIPIMMPLATFTLFWALL